jgi:phospholipase C
MSAGLDNLKHIVVLMMENRSFDHMLGSLTAQDPRIDGLTGDKSNPDTAETSVQAQPLAEYQSQLYPDPLHDFQDVDEQIFAGSQSNPRVPSMQGFIKNYYTQQEDIDHSHMIMYYFKPDKLPMLTSLARKYAVFNSWFSSIPGPTICNRAFAHFGTSFGHTDMSVLYLNEKYLSVYQRMVNAGHTAKIYYYDQQSSTMGLVFLLKQQPKLFGTFPQFLADCKSGNLAEYTFIEPNYKDHPTDTGEEVASDQHPDHDVRAGEAFISDVYKAIRSKQELWESTALLIVYDEHGGIYDHVSPPACTPDEFPDKATGFKFDRLGVRVPAVLVSPWVPEGTVVDGRTFEHASIPATVTEHFLGNYDQRTDREKQAETFLDLLSLPAARGDFVPPLGVAAGTDAQGLLAATPAQGKRPGVMNPDRKMSALLQEQVKHFHEAEMTLSEDQQTGIDASKLTTERDASSYVGQVTAKLVAAGSGS